MKKKAHISLPARCFTVSFCVLLIFIFAVSALSITVGAQTVFSDVDENSWYSDSVETVCALGYMVGTSENTFSPENSFTVAEGITVASRLHAAYASNSANMANTPEYFTKSGETGAWYEPYVSYAAEHGIISDGQFDSYERNMTRAEMASVIVGALPEEMLEEVNTSVQIPDVNDQTPYADSVRKLYLAGITVGSDSNGSFLPFSDIKRCEVAAILCRVADEDERIVKNVNTDIYPRYLIDDVSMSGKWGIQSGWNYDNKYQPGNTTGKTSATLFGGSDGAVALYRPIEPADKGILRFDSALSVSTDDANGIYISFENQNNESLITVFTSDGYFNVEGNETIKTDISVSSGIYALNINLDLDTGKAEITINGKHAGQHTLKLSDSVCRLNIGIQKGSLASVTVLSARLTADYAVNDNFLACDSMEGMPLPGGWECNGTVSIRKIESEKGADVYSARADGAAGASKFFDKLSGNIIFECALLIPRSVSSVSFSALNLTGSDYTDVLKIETSGNNFIFGDHKTSFTDNVWQNLRIEADTRTGKASGFVNGKLIGESDFSAADFSGVSISSGSGEMWFDDVKVYVKNEYADYPGEPESDEKNDGYNVVLNVCNLWRNGTHSEGWEVVAPFEELTPLLGYYDEGLPEVADWELKWMAEHGIDIQHVCWYSPSAAPSAPIKCASMEQTALDNGYKYAKNSKYVDFCIMWENGSMTSYYGLDNFKEYIWNYFKDHYFSDERYARLDNKALLTIWSMSNFVSFFGSEDGARQALEFMREDIKSLGYDGLIVWFGDGGGSVNPATLQKAASLGADAVYPYNFGTSGSSAEHQISRLNAALSQETIHYVPGVSVGFNAIARHDERSEMIPVSGHRQVCEFIRDSYLPQSQDSSWISNTLVISSWNEFSEGTYVSPSALYGFGYIDNVRSVFTEMPEEHDDALPSAVSLDRMNNLYPASNIPIRILRQEKPASKVIDGETVLKYDFENQEDLDKWDAQFGITNFDKSGNSVKGTGTSGDYAIKLTDKLSLNLTQTGADTIHVRMKTSKAAKSELYFITESDTVYNDNKRVVWQHSAKDEFVDYYVDLTQCAAWTGTVTGLRLDPLTVPGDFEITLIEFIKSSSEQDGISVKFNGCEMKFDFEPQYDANLDDILVSANPRFGFFSMLQTYYEYDKSDGTLLVESPEKSVLFTAGSSSVIIDGTAADAGFVLEMRDGLPVFPIKKLALLLGYSYSQTGNTIDISTIYNEDNPDEAPVIEWNFDKDGLSDNWKLMNAQGYIEDGILHGTPTYRDPAVVCSDLFIDADKYSKVVVGYKYQCDIPENQWIQVFFSTVDKTSYSEDFSVKQDLSEYDTKGNIVEITLDMSTCPGWDGFITSLRIDPFYGTGYFGIDYIKIVP